LTEPINYMRLWLNLRLKAQNNHRLMGCLEEMEELYHQEALGQLHDPFDVVQESDECDTCGKRAQLTMNEDGDSVCRACAAKHWGYYLAGYEREHQWWKENVEIHLCPKCGNYSAETHDENEGYFWCVGCNTSWEGGLPNVK